MANVIIFSKNRPMQLDLLLRSFKKHFKEWEQTNKSIIYVATTSEFEKGYEIVKSKHPEFKFLQEEIFKQDILRCVDPSVQYTMFLVDDIIFKEDFSASDPVFGIVKNNPRMINLSLRLHPGVHACYAVNKSSNLPNFVRQVQNHYKVWTWLGAEYDWGYSNSLDGDIFNTSFIAPLLVKYNYNNPNQLEAILNDQRIITPFWPTYKCCYDGPSKLINNPVNRVQNEFQNRFQGTISAEQLNELFLQGKRISLENISYNFKNNGMVHYPIDYQFI